MCAARAESLAFALIVLSAESYYAAEMQSSPRAIAYRRVSTEQQADSGLGLEAQQASGSAAANRIGLTLAETFSDAGISGSLAIEARPVLLDAVAAVGHAGSAEELAARPWSQVQPWLAHDDAFLLADLLRARADCGRGSGAAAAWVTAQLARPRDELDPPPLLTGGDLLAAGVPAGRTMGEMLTQLRALQLDGKIATREAALEWVK